MKEGGWRDPINSSPTRRAILNICQKQTALLAAHHRARSAYFHFEILALGFAI
jgi:hypothetical protein